LRVDGTLETASAPYNAADHLQAKDNGDTTYITTLHSTAKIGGEVDYIINGNTPDDDANNDGFIDRDEGKISNAGDLLYNGPLCAPNTDKCATQKLALDPTIDTPGELVRLSTSVVLAQSSALQESSFIITNCGSPLDNTCPSSTATNFVYRIGTGACFRLKLADSNGNALPIGSTLEIEGGIAGDIEGGGDEDKLTQDLPNNSIEPFIYDLYVYKDGTNVVEDKIDFLL
jgi:hypothetical protein